MGLADVHAHLTHPVLAADVEGVLARAAAAGLTTIVANGLNPDDDAAVLDLAERHPAVRPALGLYPVDAVLPELRAAGGDHPRRGPAWPAEDAVAWIRARVERAVAIGEIGLDGHWVPAELWPRQEAVFRMLLALARAADQPVIVHSRRRERRAFEIVQEMGVTRVDWHCFGGKVTLARELTAAGHYLSIPANVRRSESFRRMVETLPRDRLLLETDCPYLGPDRSARSEPANVALTADFVAEAWGVTRTEVEARLSENFVRLFGFAP